jgi:hypothetical protein
MPSRRSSLTPAYGWNVKSGRYVNLSTGRFVSADDVRRALNTALDQATIEAQRLSRDLMNKRISLAEWQIGMAKQIKNAHHASAALAKGGWAQMTAKDNGALGPVVKAQYGYLAAFAEQIATGEQKLDGTFLRRVALYTQAPRGTYHAIEERGMQAQGKTECRNVLGPADHCDGCLTETAKGWVPIGALVPIGSRLCLSNCRCRLEYR